MADDSVVNKNFDPFGWMKEQTQDFRNMAEAMEKSGFKQQSQKRGEMCLIAYVPIGGNHDGCISGDKGCVGGNWYEYCLSCYSKCQTDYSDWYSCYTSCNTLCNDGCDAGQAYRSEETKQGCTSAYGVCSAACDACESCQGCESCQSMDKAEDAQSSIIKNVDEAVTRRARGEGYSKAAANMIGGGSAQDATAQNFNSLAMQQNQAANTTQADWLSKQGYLDALDQEIKNKKASQGLETVGAFFNF